MGDRYYSTSTAFLEALAEAGIRYMFANLGSNPAAVGELVQLADALAVPVIGASPNHVNFRDIHPMHHGYQWHTAAQNPLLAVDARAG